MKILNVKILFPAPPNTKMLNKSLKPRIGAGRGKKTVI